jgi:hypothetical protein
MVKPGYRSFYLQSQSPRLYPLGEAQGVLLLEPEDDLLEDTLEFPDDDVSEKELEA